MPATEIMSDVVRAATVAMVFGNVVLHVAKRKRLVNSCVATLWAVGVCEYLFVDYHYGMDFLGVSFCFGVSLVALLRALSERKWNRVVYRALFGQRFVDRIDLANERVRRMIDGE